MFFLFIRIVFLCVLVLGVTYMLHKLLRISREDEIQEALDKQDKAKLLAKKVELLNPEEIINNETKVKETLDKLN